MGLGNGNAKTGDKGSNHNYEHRHLLILGQIIAALSGGGPGPALATEGTLISVLNAVIASDQDIEILLVRDTGNGDLVVQQITDYQTGVPVISYKDVDGAAYVPTGPLEYLDPSAVLNLLLTEALAQGVTLDAILVDTTSIAGEDFATQTTLAALLVELQAKADLSETQPVSAASLPLPTGASTEATLAAQALDIGLIEGYLAGSTRTHNSVIAVGVGTVPAGSYAGSVLNTGAAAATWNGISLPAGVGMPWSKMGENDTYAVIAYDATGTTLVIEYTT